MQERRNSIANALELRLSCISPSICYKGMQLVPSHLDRSDHVITGQDRSSLVILSAFFPLLTTIHQCHRNRCTQCTRKWDAKLIALGHQYKKPSCPPWELSDNFYNVFLNENWFVTTFLFRCYFVNPKQIWQIVQLNLKFTNVITCQCKFHYLCLLQSTSTREITILYSTFRQRAISLYLLYLGKSCICKTHKSHNTLVSYSTMHHAEQKCDYFCSECALWDMGHMHFGICEFGIFFAHRVTRRCIYLQIRRIGVKGFCEAYTQ